MWLIGKCNTAGQGVCAYTLSKLSWRYHESGIKDFTKRKGATNVM